MVRLLLMFAVIIKCVYGRSQLPPLPMKDGCHLVNPELRIYRMEGDAVILSFPMFERVLEVRRIAPPNANFVIAKGNGSDGVSYQGDGRVQQRNKQLWFLPAEASDSGVYVCTYRNETYCVTGSIRLHVYQPDAVDLSKLSYPISLALGEKLWYGCPSVSVFNKTDGPIEWHKDSSPTDLQRGPPPQINGKLMIPAVKRSHAGVYTCIVRVLINSQQYKVSRFVLLQVQGLDPAIATTPTLSDLSTTSNPGIISSSYSTAQMIPPVIVWPLNGTIFESPHGSRLELFCKVLTGCQMAESTLVTWLVNGQSVESSYLDGRALQEGRRVTRLPEGCQVELRLIIVKVTDEDVEAELRCVTQNRGGRQEVVTLLKLEDSKVTWLVVAAVGVSCFLAVVFVFLCILFKARRKEKMDYILARQNSTF